MEISIWQCLNLENPMTVRELEEALKKIPEKYKDLQIKRMDDGDPRSVSCGYLHGTKEKVVLLDDWYRGKELEDPLFADPVVTAGIERDRIGNKPFSADSWSITARYYEDAGGVVTLVVTDEHHSEIHTGNFTVYRGKNSFVTSTSLSYSFKDLLEHVARKVRDMDYGNRLATEQTFHEIKQYINVLIQEWKEQDYKNQMMKWRISHECNC